MHDSFYSLVAGTLLALATGVVNANPMTERFIPIGQSPGLSGTVTFIGTVDSIERTDMIITVRNQNQSRRAKVTEFTNIWLDRSAVGQPSTVGSFPEVRVGSHVEVKFRDADPAGAAEWIKVQAQ